MILTAQASPPTATYKLGLEAPGKKLACTKNALGTPFCVPTDSSLVVLFCFVYSFRGWGLEWESSLLLCHRGRFIGLHKGQVTLRVNRNSYRFSCLVNKN